jgi:regulator of protease activity HflC (stomatin/prohibitin superfamily)
MNLNPLAILAIVIALLAVVIVIRSVKVIPQAQAAVIERLGRYSKTSYAGLVWLFPFLDRVRARIDMREQVVSFPPQPVITQDNLTVSIDTVVYFQVNEPRSAVYEIANYIVAVEQLTTTTLRNVVGGMSLEETLTSRDAINGQLRGVLDEATGKWGLRVARVELKSIDPPPSIQDSMEKQMRADRDKRAIILTAEGQRIAAITTAEGQKQAAVLSAEGQKQAAILAAEGERQSAILRAEGERAARFLQAQGQAKAIEKVFAAVKNGKPTPELLAYQYLQTLPQLAQGDANKVWMIPSGFDKALEQFARMFGEKGEDGVFRYEPPTTDGASRPVGEMDDDVKQWFEGSSAAELAEQDRLRTEQATAQAAAEIQAAQLTPPGGQMPRNPGPPELPGGTPGGSRSQQPQPQPQPQSEQQPQHYPPQQTGPQPGYGWGPGGPGQQPATGPITGYPPAYPPGQQPPSYAPQFPPREGDPRQR